MPYNPDIHHRNSIRLKGYDYSQAGLYFITICCQNRKRLFGKIRRCEMILNEAGKMIEKWYYELENKFPDIRCHEMIIMPNHFHCIIEIVGADLRVCPNNNPTAAEHNNPTAAEHQNPTAEHIGSSVHRVVQWFKTMTTNEYIHGVKKMSWPSFDKKLWQRNYWEHIIRNSDEYQSISNYIIANPQNWNGDKLKK